MDRLPLLLERFKDLRIEVGVGIERFPGEELVVSRSHICQRKAAAVIRARRPVKVGAIALFGRNKNDLHAPVRFLFGVYENSTDPADLGAQNDVQSSRCGTRNKQRTVEDIAAVVTRFLDVVAGLEQ